MKILIQDGFMILASTLAIISGLDELLLSRKNKSKRKDQINSFFIPF